MKQMHNNHFKRCGITKEDYIIKYGYPNKYYEMDAILKEVISKVWDLYVSTTTKWIILNSYTREYVTKETKDIYEENKEKELEHKKQGLENVRLYKQIPKLTEAQFKDHLIGKNTLGVFPNYNTSKFLVFDVDSCCGLLEAREVADQIKHFLLLYFDSNEIHINFSGNKGYHVTLFFDNYLDINYLFRVYDIVLDEIKIQNYEDIQVEIRPTLSGIKGYGVKLPLGINFANKDNNRNYAYFVDDNFNQVNNEIDYVLNIKKSDSRIVNEIIKDYQMQEIKDVRVTSRKSETTYNIKNSLSFHEIEKVINDGLTQIGTRHKWSFLIALYYKKQGVEKDEAYNRLLEWNYKQLYNNMCNSDEYKIERDVKAIIFKGVYSKNKNYNLPKFRTDKKNFYLTKEDINMLINLNDYAKKTGKAMITNQKVLMALMIHGKVYGDEDGIFYMTYNQILKLSDLNNFTAIKKSIDMLVELKYVSIIKKAEFNILEIQSTPNYFKILTKNGGSMERAIDLPMSFDNDSFYKIIIDYFGYENLNKVFTRGIIERVKKKYIK